MTSYERRGDLFELEQFADTSAVEGIRSAPE